MYAVITDFTYLREKGHNRRIFLTVYKVGVKVRNMKMDLTSGTYIRQTKVTTPISYNKPIFLYVFTHIMRVILDQMYYGYIAGLGRNRSAQPAYFLFGSKASLADLYLPRPLIYQLYFWSKMTLKICVKTYVKFGLLKEIGVVTLVCLIYVPDVKR